MKRKPNNWDANADYGSDILAVSVNVPRKYLKQKVTK